jgi:predicted Zn-dependent peptidase
MLARERFLNPNNATLTIVGGVQPGRAMRALRQLLGIWRKSEQVVPATFRQPIKPDVRTLIVNGPGDQSVEVRFAVRGLARRDPDALTASLLANVARARWENTLPELSRSPIFVRHDAFTLPGMLVMGTTIDHLLAGKALTSAEEILKALATTPVTPSELEQAKSELLAAINKELGTPDGLTDAWLDIDTYGAQSTTEMIRMINSITPAEMLRTAGRLFSPGAFATVVVGSSDLLKTQLEAQRKIEIMGAMESKSDNDQNQKKTNAATGSKPE